MTTDATGRKHMNRLINAVSNYAFRGAAHPDDRWEIELEFANAKAAMIRHMQRRMARIAELEDALDLTTGIEGGSEAFLKIKAGLESAIAKINGEAQ